MKKLRTALTVALLANFNFSTAQDCGVHVPGESFGGTLGNAFQRPPPLAYAFVREADVMWSKRYWRVIDLREKINHVYFYPIEPTAGRQNFVCTILNSICAGELYPYDAMNDEFTVTLTRAEVVAKTTTEETLTFEDSDGVSQQQKVYNSFDPASVKRLRLKEEWYFHNGRSTMEKRIIGICPIVEKYDENGEYKGEMPLFWIYYPAARYTLQLQKVQNHHNVAEPFTYDRLLQIRYFSSYVYKVSNVHDRTIASYKVAGLDALLEGEKIETELFNYEQDLWEY